MEKCNDYLACCPCCAGVAELQSDEWGVMVRCSECGVNTGGEFGAKGQLDVTPEQVAIDTWNKRVTLAF